MILSGRLISLPYAVMWRAMERRDRTPPLMFYCGDLLDWIVFEPIHRNLPPTPIVAKNRVVQRELAREGVSASVWPAFPRAVIMARHALHRFPSASITKIGLRHGAYHFKRLISPARYNAFDLYLFTSTHEVHIAEAHGITCGAAGGFPKMDPMFALRAQEEAREVGHGIGLRAGLPTVLFTATWDRSGQSAVDRWCGRLEELANRYNVTVTVHPATSRHWIEIIRRQEGVHLIQERTTWPYLLLADVMVGDTSSILAEFCALDKPMVTFRVGGGSRMTGEIEALLASISLRIDSFDELAPAIERSLANPAAQSSERRRHATSMFDELDGAHGRRAADHILRLLRSRGIVQW